MNMKKEVTIIILNYNGLHFMEPCFQALDQQTFKDFDILVVDNGSTDGSPAWIKEHQIPSILLKENTGFCKGVNIGIKAVDTPYVILLNNDTRVDPDFAGQLLKAIKQSERIFSVSSKMIQMYDTKRMDDAGDMYTVLGWAYQRGVGQSSTGYNKAREVFSACAGAAIYRRDLIEKVGYFDEMHFAYLEDLDIGYRAKIAGYYNRYWPQAVVYHVGSGTSGSKYNSFKVKLAARNNVYLNYKNMPLLQLMVNFLPIALGIFLKYRFFKKIGFGKDYLEGLREGIFTAKNCKKVSYRPEHFKHYLSIEWELIAGTFIYVYEFTKRKLTTI